MTLAEDEAKQKINDLLSGKNIGLTSKQAILTSLVIDMKLRGEMSIDRADKVLEYLEEVFYLAYKRLGT